jgi:hypothetical protein
MVAEYVGRIHEQVKQRPLYLVKDWLGLPGTPGAAGSAAGSAITRGE